MRAEGVGPATSSAIVASWVEWGIFQSDELVQALRGRGCKVVYSEGFYKKFYAEAIEVLKTLEGKKEGKGVQSGRVLERLAWGMFYAPDAAKIEETQSAKDEAVELQAEKAAKEGSLRRKPHKTRQNASPSMSSRSPSRQRSCLTLVEGRQNVFERKCLPHERVNSTVAACRYAYIHAWSHIAARQLGSASRFHLRYFIQHASSFLAR